MCRLAGDNHIDGCNALRQSHPHFRLHQAFRRIATRYEKTDKCFAAIINLVAILLWTR
jgi:transposase